MAEYEDQISDEEKGRIANAFITHAPPGEVETVMKDVRVLLDNNSSFSDGMLSSLAKHRLDQFSPAQLDNDLVLITNHAKMDNGRFYDPKTKKTFQYNYSSKLITDVQPNDIDCPSEVWRKELETSVEKYVKEFFPHGVCAVYSKPGPVLVVCIEDHKFSPENFWNGRWRSEWHITVESGNANVVGLLKTQVHYYEDGNVQLVSQKECKETLTVSGEKQLAVDVTKFISKCESEYQTAIANNYASMSSTTFKALRRQLPMTRMKIDWNKILGYKIGKEIGK